MLGMRGAHHSVRATRSHASPRMASRVMRDISIVPQSGEFAPFLPIRSREGQVVFSGLAVLERAFPIKINRSTTGG
jgi:hypothetical protein